MSDRLPCRDFVELVTDYLENTMDATLRARVEDHLAECEGCSAYLAQIRLTIDVAGTVEDDDLSPQAWAELRAAFRGLD